MDLFEAKIEALQPVIGNTGVNMYNHAMVVFLELSQLIRGRQYSLFVIMIDHSSGYKDQKMIVSGNPGILITKRHYKISAGDTFSHV